MGLAATPAPSTFDPAAFKERQRQVWSTFEPLAGATMPAAARLVRFAQVRGGDRVLDVGTGTGNVAITAAREGATVTGLDLTPNLLGAARRMAAVVGAQVDWKEGDAEQLPFPDASFDVVLSQFGHMFAPRPEVAVREMLRVLRPGGRIAFATWPPESLPGRMFRFQGKAMPLPPGVPPPTQWGETDVIAARLGAGVRDLRFERGSFGVNALGPRHFLAWQEEIVPPLRAAIEAVGRQGAAAVAAFRAEYLSGIEPFFDGNEVRHDYLMTRAIKQ